MPQLTLSLPEPAKAQLTGFWRWWSGELEASLPAGLANPRKPKPFSEIHLRRSGVSILREREGTGERFAETVPLEELDEQGWAELAALVDGTHARVILHSPDCFTTTLTLPAGARTRLRSAVALHLAGAAPLDLSLLAWNCKIIAADKKEIRVLVGMARAVRINEIQQLFESNGLAAPPVHAGEFIENMELATGCGGNLELRDRKHRQAFALGAALLASIPLTTCGGASLLASMEEARVATLQEQLAPRLAAEARAAKIEQLNKALRPLFEHPSATSTIENLALGLPESSFAVAAERRQDGTLLVETETSDREALEEGLGENPLLASLNPADVSDGAEGRTLVSYRSSRR